MTTYHLQKAIFDHLRALETPDSTRAPDDIATDDYDLEADELAALQKGDVAAFHDHGVHPVLINGYCRANNWKRADYKTLFRDDQIAAMTSTGRARWHRS